jgi:hypothetical protein
MSVLVDTPKRNSVAESIVKLKNSSCRSTVEPSRGTASIRCEMCVSKVSRSATWERVKLGRIMARLLSHAAPSVSKMPCPKTGTKARARRGPKAKSLKLVDRTVFTFSGSMVDITIKSQLKALHSLFSGYTDHTICSKQVELHGVMAIHEEPLLHCLVRPLFLAGRYDFLDEVDAQHLAEDALVGILVRWLAAMFLDHPPPASTSGEFIVGTLEHQKSKD